MWKDIYSSCHMVQRGDTSLTRHSNLSVTSKHQLRSFKVSKTCPSNTWTCFYFYAVTKKLLTMYYTQNKSTIITWSNLYFWMQEMRWMISSFTLNYEKSRSNKAGACIKFEYQTNIYNLPSYTCTIYIWICIWKILLTVTQRL